MESFEVLRPCNANGGAVVAIAPGDIVLAVQGRNPGVVAVFLVEDFFLRAFHAQGLILNLPVIAVLAASGEQVHADGAAVAAEYARKTILKGYYRAVKYGVRTLVTVPANNRVAGEPPHGHGFSRGLILPGDIRKRLANDFGHTITLAFLDTLGDAIGGPAVVRPRHGP